MEQVSKGRQEQESSHPDLLLWHGSQLRCVNTAISCLFKNLGRKLVSWKLENEHTHKRPKFSKTEGQETACEATEPSQWRKKTWLKIRWGDWESSPGFPFWLLHGWAVWHCSAFLELRRWRSCTFHTDAHVLWRVISCWLYLHTQTDLAFMLFDFWRTVAEREVDCPTGGRVYKHGPSASQSPKIPCVRFIWVI